MAEVDKLLAHQKFEHLKPEQVQSFMKYGFLVVKKAFSKEAAEEWSKDVWTRLGIDPDDKETWHTERTNMPEHRRVQVKEIAPKAWDAICELAGGENRLTEKSGTWSDSFIVNLGTKENEGRETVPKELSNWHVDGDFFVHFLDSAEQGLLVIPCWTDVVRNGGATWICDEGPKRIGKWLMDHPEGTNPRMVPVGQQPMHEGLGFYEEIVKQCPDSSFHEMTGEQGDVILLHPLMLHSASKNGRRAIRIITNPPVHLKEPFNFDRADASEYSLVELKTIKELGRESLTGWRITGERKKIVPERVRMQAEMLRAENERLGKQGIAVVRREVVVP